MSRSPNLAMPFIMPAQAQKHVTHNEAIELLDILVQLQIDDLDINEPPLDPVEGQVVSVGTEARGRFEGRAGELACFYGGGWLFITPREGFRAWVMSRNALHIYQSGAWRLLSEDGSTGKVEGLGVNTTWDTSNRLSVELEATLLSHEGAGHQLKLNKAAEADTASLVFQHAFSGRAEMGLVGNDDFSVKVSADGNYWATALSVNAKSGKTSIAEISTAKIEGLAVQAHPEDTTPGRLMRADWGYSTGNILGKVSLKGERPSGSIFERGMNSSGSYTRTADGRVEIITELLVDTRSSNIQIFPLPVNLINNISPVSFSHVGSNPNPLISYSNFEMARAKREFIEIKLKETGSPWQDPNNQKIVCFVKGYWF